MLTPGGSWYRPYLIWSLVIIATFIMQLGGKESDDI
jgi:hypothetical protein